MSAVSERSAAPTRARPFAKTQVPTPPWLHLILGRELAPSREEYDAAVAAMTDGDPAMDALVDWMVSFGPREARALFEQAMAQGTDSVPDCPQPLRDFFATVERVPAWLDPQAVRDGVRFIHGVGEIAMVVMRDLALMGGYLLSGFNQALVMTGALNQGTSQRVAETGKWWMDCTEPGGLERHGAGFRSTLHVRLVHALVRRNLSARPEWDHAVWGLPLNQIDMAATYLGFSVVMLGALRKLGIQATPRESRGVMQLWSHACWLMGVDECWLRFSETEGMVLLNTAMMTQSRPDQTSRELGHALSREPLERTYQGLRRLPWLHDLRRKLAYHQHLSMSRYFLTREQMGQLGLPETVTAWYPWLTLAPRTLAYTGQRLLPALHRRMQARGRQAQRAAVAQVFGDRAQGIIQPGADHPAHAAQHGA